MSLRGGIESGPNLAVMYLQNTRIRCLLGKHTIKKTHRLPLAIHAPCQISMALRDEVKIELHNVTGGQKPTDWVNSLAFVDKPSTIKNMHGIS